MKQQHSANAKAPRILDKVSSLTAIRDIDIFQFSFIKTIADMLQVNEISLYKFNDSNQACRLVRYTSDIELGNGKQKIGETKEIHIENILVPEAILRAQKWINLTDRVYTLHVDNEYLTVYPVVGVRRTIGYLAVTLKHELSSSENLVITNLLSISENFHALLEDNQRDKLTGLLNRKTFDESIYRLQEVITFTASSDSNYAGNEQRQVSTAPSYWLSIIDIDSFKRINDDFGHIYGDEVILMLSQIMQKTFRPSDLLYRFGGEEFVVITMVDNKKDAVSMFERFRQAIESFDFPQIGQVTISLGATLISNHHAIASDIVGQADKALYHAKHNGKNQLFFYEDLIAEGILVETCKNGDIDLF